MKSEAFLEFVLPNSGENEGTVESSQGSRTLQRSIL